MCIGSTKGIFRPAFSSSRIAANRRRSLTQEDNGIPAKSADSVKASFSKSVNLICNTLRFSMFYIVMQYQLQSQYGLGIVMQ